MIPGPGRPGRNTVPAIVTPSSVLKETSCEVAACAAPARSDTHTAAMEIRRGHDDSSNAIISRTARSRPTSADRATMLCPMLSSTISRMAAIGRMLT